MILNENSIAIAIAMKDDLEILKQTLPVWVRVAAAYGNGSEIFLIDNGSSDGTADYFDTYLSSYVSSGVRIIFVNNPEGNKSEGYNKIKELVVAKFVLFTNGNCYPNGPILNEYEYYIEENEKLVLNGIRKQVIAPFNYSIMKIEQMEHYQAWLDMEYSKEPYKYFIGNNSVFPVALLDEVGWWNTRFDVGADTELAMVCFYKAKAKFKAIDSAIMFTCGLGEEVSLPASQRNLDTLKVRYEQGNFNRNPRSKPRKKTV